MSLDEFLHHLHFDIEKASIPNWEVDWEDKPLPYKLYRGLPVFPLSLEVPLTLEGQEQPATPNLSKIGHFLWYVYGLTQFSQSVFSLDSTEKTQDLMQSYRRFAPSGGALYPNELYVYLKIEDLPVGVYHYDVAHHRLVLLREGNFDSYIARALGNRCEIPACFGTVFISTMFWKNFFKYNNFSYRLQGLDAGVLIGQLLEVSKRFGFESGVYFQFLDRAMNHLLGLTEKEESVYGVIPLSVEPTIWSANGSEKDRMVSAAELCRELTPIHPHHYVKSQRLKEYLMLTKLNEVSMLDSTTKFQLIEADKKECFEGQAVTLPHAERQSYDLGSVCRKRFSPDMDFILGKVSPLEMANLLRGAMDSFLYRNDLEAVYQKNEPRVSLNVCLYNVEGIPNGAYQYDSTSHQLRPVNLGDHRLLLQSGMSLYNVNLLQVPLCIHITGVKDYYKTTLGYRGYRIQQMEAGMLVQRLLLSAGASGMGGHPLLGYDSNLCDEIYRMEPQGKTSLIQIPIGPYRPRPWLIGGLSS
ncbi:SagB family peptide dehydrogenase [Neobacillus niacini]|uniref:SagB family peptide dehydrogenase n=1 Tax=Neobacillus niacini TaxID=86668 RepID=UPI00052F727E|nr:SagB family peptide dehydrogenase [Neobacillus niacini]KGM44762.1 NADH oxidase [Neobacillus niacini]MEC1525479.1 SagB family peptide dehydrogenase [Neobacillus niacini]